MYFFDVHATEKMNLTDHKSLKGGAVAPPCVFIPKKEK